MSDLSPLLTLIPGLPLAAALLTALLGKRWLKEYSHLPALLAVAGSFVLSLMLLDGVSNGIHRAKLSGEAAHATGFEKVYTLWEWVNVADANVAHLPTGSTLAHPFRIGVDLRADTLTATMLAMVTFVSALIVFYSKGYMHGDPGYWRFFTYISLFVFSMCMLVSVSNFLMLYVFWEAVGVCSYLLIGFWFQKPDAVAAGKKAFLVNRIGDFGFALGVFLIWTTYGTLNFHDSKQQSEIRTTGGEIISGDSRSTGVLGQTRLNPVKYLPSITHLTSGQEFSHPDDFHSGPVALGICLLLFLGACGKSAQFPLHVWLPDAMEGPTPVSALIHAATMVTAGVYMVARCAPLFAAAPKAQLVVSGIGCFTALLAGAIAVTQTDLKRVLAYSTVSQLGFMFLGLGAGSLAGVTSGMFHLFTHAFFKALLFLGAGSVMHAMGGVIDMRYFGGLRRRMPTTHWTFLFGCLALSGILPFAGFFSKDAILAAVHENHDPIYGLYYQAMYYTALFTAFLTAFYTFRAFFMTFYGPEQIPSQAGRHAHESPSDMTIPLRVLAICALVVGIAFGYTGKFDDWLKQTPSLAYLDHAVHGATAAAVEHDANAHTVVAATSTVVALLGIALAAMVYLGNRQLADRFAGLLRPLYVASHGKFFFDEIYQVTLVWPLQLFAHVCYAVDRWIIDGLVDFFGWLPSALGSRLRSLQIGLVQFYALAMVLGLLVLIGTLLKWPPA